MKKKTFEVQVEKSLYFVGYISVTAKDQESANRFVHDKIQNCDMTIEDVKEWDEGTYQDNSFIVPEVQS